MYIVIFIVMNCSNIVCTVRNLYRVIAQYLSTEGVATAAVVAGMHGCHRFVCLEQQKSKVRSSFGLNCVHVSQQHVICMHVCGVCMYGM